MEQSLLKDVIERLKDDPPLLFGIGAGIVLVGILAVTTSIVIVAIVAGVLLAALAAWLVRESRALAADDQSTHVDVDNAEFRDDADVGNIVGDGTGRKTTNVTAQGATFGDGANLGGIQTRGSRKRKRG